MLPLIAAAVMTAGLAVDAGGTAVRAQSGPGVRADNCAPNPARLGVSRVLEIDTKQGPRFGLQQYKDHDFLREGEVVLTFDDGPLRRHTKLVLEALAAHCTQATFFMVGQMALADPEMVREVARQGHSIAIHTWSHRNLRAIGAAKATQEIELGISAVTRALGGQVTPFFRFPYLADSQAMLHHLSERNFGVFSIDADSRDFRTHDPRQMQKTLLDALTPKRKGILLFHDIQLSTAHGIRSVLDELAKRGYKVVHIVPKGGASTQPSYDAMAEAELARRSRIAGANPMAPRSVVWPIAQTGAPVEHYRPEGGAGVPSSTTGPQKGPARPVVRPLIVQPAPLPVPTAAPAPVVQGPPPALNPPVLRGTTEEDWRRRVFQY